MTPITPCETPADLDGGYRKGSPELRRAGVALFLAGIATFAQLYSTQAILPELSRQFGITPADASLSVSVSTAGIGVGLLIAGPLSEVVGRTRLIHFSLFAAGAMAILCVFAPSWQWLLVGRGIEGLALAGLPAVAAVYLREEVHASLASSATGLYIAGTTFGGMAGRLISAGLTEWGSRVGTSGWPIPIEVWQLAVGGNAVLALGCAVACLVLLPASRRFVPAPRSIRHLARQSIRVFADPALLALYGIAALMMGAFVGVYNTIGFRLEAEPYLLSVGLAGLVFCVYPVGGVGSVIAGRLADRFGQRAIVPAAATITIIGLLLMAARPLPLIIVGIALMTAGFFAVHGVASGWVAARAGAGVGGAGQAVAMYMLFYYLGSSVGGSAAGVAFSGFGWSGVTVLTVSLVGLALVLGLLLRRTKRLTRR
ncbi:MFS transporter [Saxibacter everestensis]|uniref:MFS transporter n=1 Tax=Saxibacter everestensis TaxID=2909229 RepID=A0ABY8QS76_9MICO|nr:MFS transporter [Brevibacteriaceae bacterium ZFBP1038]